jgi:hypothetical protein
MYIISKMLKKIWAHLASLASIIALIFLIKPENTKVTILMGVLIALSIVFFAITLIQEYKEVIQNHGKHYKNKKEIRNYMFNWINNGGRVTIFTRDMSWVDDDDMRNMLIQKAQRNELTIILHDKIRLSDELKSKGANIITYKELDYIPKSRFTIINTDRSDSKVAIGRRTNDNKHLIREFSTSDEPEFSLATDLAKILDKYNTLMREIKNNEVAASRLEDRD